MAIVGQAHIVVNANTTNFQRQLQQAVRGAQGAVGRDADNLGRTIARGMSNGTRSFSVFEKEARRANDTFFRLVTTGYALGPAIAGLVGGISSLVSGLFALASQAAAAVPSLIVLPSIFAAIAQGAITAKLAFSGVGAALSAMGKKAGGGGKDTEAALRRIEDAERNLALVMERNREMLVRAAEAVTEAEDNLTEARKRASESLQQLNFDAEDAAISEQRAAIELEKARETLMRVQDLPPNNTARREAELAFAEADLNYRRAVDRNKDLAKETEEANAKGVEGSDEVVEASERLQEAKDDQARAERDALRAQEDAIRALEDAKRALNEGAGAAGGMNDAMAKLSKEAQDFVRYLFSLRGEIKKLRAAAGQELFPKLTTAIQLFVDRLFPRLIPILQETGSAIGDVAVNFASVLTKTRQLDSIDRIAGQNATTIRRLGAAGTNLAVIFIDLLDAARPLIDRFTKWTIALTSGWRESIKAKKSTGDLTETFRKAGDVAAQIGRIFSNITDALFDIGKEASGPGSGGQKLMDAFEGATEKFKTFVKEVSKDGKLKQFFNDVADNTIKIGQLVVKIADAFLRLGNDKGVGGFADSLKPAVDNIGKMFTILIDGGPALGTFITSLTGLMLVFTETGSIKTFFSILTSAVDALTRFFSRPEVMQFLMIAAPIFGAVKAFTLLTKVGGFAFKVIGGYVVKIVGLFGKIGTAARVVGAIFGTTAGPVLLIAAAIAAVIAVLVMAYKKSEKFRDAISEVVDLVKNTLGVAFEEIKAVIQEVFGGEGKASMEGFTDIFEKIGDVLSYVVPIIGSALVGAIKVVTSVIKGAIYFVGAFVGVIKSVIKFVQGIIALFQGDFAKAGKLFKEAWSAIKDAARLAIKGVITILKGLWEYFKKIPQLMWKAMKLAWKLIISAVKEGIKLAIKLIKELPKLAGKFFSMLWDKFKDLVKAVIPWFGDRIKDLLEFVKAIPGKVARFLANVWDAFKDGVRALIEWFGDRIDDIVDFVKKLPGRFATAIKTLWDAYREGVRAVVSWFGDRIDDIVDFIKELPGRFAQGIVNLWTAFRNGVTVLKDWFGQRIDDIVNFVKGLPGKIASAIVGLWDGFKNGVRTLKSFVGDRIDDIVGFVTGLPGKIAEAARGIWDPIKNSFTAIISTIIDAWNRLDFGISITVPSWVPFVGGNTWSVEDFIPDIGNPFRATKTPGGGARGSGDLLALASGGIVTPVPGGVLARIAEAGRPERIEPLDPNGLSKRDKAMIKMLAPGTNGSVTVNVYPSPGMNEQELAAIVSRKIAQELRIGAA